MLDRNALEQIGHVVGYKSFDRYQTKAEFLFDSIPLEGTRVLDIGCGMGAWSFWSASKGASFVQGLEPESDGSESGSVATFNRLSKKFGISEKVVCSNLRLEDFVPSKKFDVAISYASINHMDETAVSVLHEDPNAFSIYVDKLKHLKSLLSPSATVIVVDCERFNVPDRLGIPLGLTRSIEWTKHQNARTWMRVFEKAGYEFMDLRWPPLYPFGRLSQNRFVHMLTVSHFALRFRA